MATCPMCEKNNLRLNQNNHVIPRFLVKQTKDKGLNVFIGKTTINEKNFKDVKAKIVCDSCELKFKNDDDFSKLFFDDNKFFKNRTLLHGNKKIRFLS